MKEYKLTNMAKEFISLLEDRVIGYSYNDKKGISIWLPSDQDLFHLAQDYEQLRNEAKPASQMLKEIWEGKHDSK